MKNFKLSVMMMLTAVFFISCKQEELTTPETPSTLNKPIVIVDPANLVKVGETYIDGASVKAIIYAEQALFVGYNKLYVAMYDSTNLSRISNGHFEIMPMMDMGSMVHSAPYEVTEDTMPSNQLWTSAVVFIMPGMWNLNMHFHNHITDKAGEGTLSLMVTNPVTSVMKNFITTSDSTRLFISLLKPSLPQIGLNNFEVTIHQKMSMMSFPAVDDYTVEIVPEMPSMGHGSPNNVNPIHTNMGHYVGKVNFTMTGLWRVHIHLKKNGILVDNNQYFEFTF